MSTIDDKLNTIKSLCWDIHADLQDVDAVDSEVKLQELKNKLESFGESLDHHISECRNNRNELEHVGLSLNMIETEGCLRGLLFVHNLFKDIFGETKP